MRLAAVLLAASAFLPGSCGEEPAPRNMTSGEVADQLADLRIEPGLWELTTEIVDVRAPDLPREIRNNMIGPRTRARHCITPEQAERPSANFLAGQSGGECTYRDFEMRGGRMSGSMSCPGVEAQMRGRYGPTDYVTEMEMKSPIREGATMTLEVRARGNRVGECEEVQGG